MSNSYPYVLAVGVALAAVWMAFFYPRSNSESNLDLVLVALFAGLIGGRVGHVAAYWEYYNSRLAEAAQFWQGGLSWAGAALGSLVGVALYDRLLKRGFWADADRLAAPGLIVGAAGWFGCLLDACAYGQPVAHGPLMPDFLGVLAPRWPTQAIGGVLSLLALALLYRMTELELSSGLLAATALAALGAINLVVAAARGDPSPVVGGLRLDGLAAAGVLALGGLGWLIRR